MAKTLVTLVFLNLDNLSVLEAFRRLSEAFWGLSEASNLPLSLKSGSLSGSEGSNLALWASNLALLGRLEAPIWPSLQAQGILRICPF